MARQLKIYPLYSRFRHSLPSESRSTKLEGGLSRRRRHTNGSRAVVDVGWVAQNGLEYRYLRAFYRIATLDGSDPFDTYMKLKSTSLVLYEDVQFVPGTFQLQSKSGNTYSVACQMIVNIGA